MPSRTSPDVPAVDVVDITEAADRIAPWAEITPLLNSSDLDRSMGVNLLLKAEHHQVTRSFKFRGACNAIASLSDDELHHGVLAWSSGNHAQAIARAAMIHGTTAVIVMPSDAPAAKRDATLAAGARIVEYDRATGDRERIGRRIADDERRVILPPYDHPMIIAGQGTSALEILAQAAHIDHLYVCVGGGGLLAGCSTVFAARSPDTRIVGVEPLAGNDHQLSRQAGRRIIIDVPSTIADGQQTTAPGELTWPITSELVAEFSAVTDESIVRAMRVFHEHFGEKIEPSGATALAAVLENPPAGGSTVVATISGGNISDERFHDLTGIS